jgi:2-amino-4-hydroxy-6-hydroxymethyldihydropteridine pyrophosphokinase
VGSNLGDRLGTLQGCVHAISGLPETDVLAVSPVYETAPVGGPAQPDYLNAVLIVATGLPPQDLLAATQRIEAGFGRARAERFGPRTLDIDIIGYDEQISDDPVLTLPHPARTSGPSSSRRGTTSTRRPACPAAGPSPPCWPASAATASSASPI